MFVRWSITKLIGCEWPDCVGADADNRSQDYVSQNKPPEVERQSEDALSFAVRHFAPLAF